jgi:ABC-type uncharacterized transport system permease subunit
VARRAAVAAGGACWWLALATPALAHGEVTGVQDVVQDYGVLLFLVATVLIGAAVVGLALPGHPAAYLLGTLSVLLAIVVSAQTVYLVAASGFWLVEVRGLQAFYMVISGFFAGLFVPIWLFPTWLATLAQATPFPSMMMYPTDILSGRGGGQSHISRSLGVSHTIIPPPAHGR